MKRSVLQMVNRNGIEGYMDSTKQGFILRGVISSQDDIIVRVKSIDDIQGGFETLDITGVYKLLIM